MKKVFRNTVPIILILSVFIIHSCKKDKPTPPVITTTSVTAITQTTGTSGGNVSSDGGASVTAKGVCWNTSAGASVANSKTSDGSGTGIYTSSITALTSGTVYYVKAYATNSIGTSYGNEVSFTTTAATVPVLTTTAVSAITQTTATSGGNISSDGAATITARGVCWSTQTVPTTALSTKTTDGTGTGILTSSITALTAGTIYYVRAYATNSAGTAYGNEVSFTTIAATVPVLTTTAASAITQTTAASGGNITSDGAATITARGVCWSITQNPTILDNKTIDASGVGAFTSTLTGLTGNTTFYIRAYATNSVNTSYGNQVSFKTNPLTPSLSTSAMSSITYNSAISGGNIASDGGASVTARGLCWSTTTGPTSGLATKTIDTGTSSTYSNSLTGLSFNTVYYVRAYATNSAGTAYGNELIFTTLSTLPVVTTTVTSLIKSTTATSGGNITSDGGAVVTTSGVCWSTSPDPTTALSTKTTENANTGVYISSIVGLTANTTYYIRAYATNIVGTTYGSQLSFKTLAELPTITTFAISSITPTTAISGGSVTSDGGANVSSRGVCWSTIENPTIIDSKTTDGAGTVAFTSSIIGLTPSTTYYLRAYVTNSAGTGYGNQQVFTTGPVSLATLSTTAINSITQTTAAFGGDITNDNGGSVIERGICWGTATNPTTSNNKTPAGTGIGTFTVSLSGLTSNTTYYGKAFAINSIGTSYGNEIVFKTYSGTVTDSDGNIYNTVIIGTQTWTVENLKTTKYNDGTSIPLVIDASGWTNLTTAGYCYYNNNELLYKAKYGALYNWYNVNSASNGGKNICPVGWHVPTDAQWTILTGYLTNNGYGYGGSGSDVAKSMAAPSGWNIYSTVGTVGNDQASNNSSGFTAVPSNWRNHDGTFQNVSGYGVQFWSSTETTTIKGYLLGVLNYVMDAYRNFNDEKDGLSVRCLKD